MNKNSTLQENVKSKIYQLVDPALLRPLTEPYPKVVENPFARSGYEEIWEPVLYPPVAGYSAKDAYCRLVKLSPENGYSSKKLVRCGDVWYLKEYFDPDGNPFRFAYGPVGSDREENVQDFVMHNDNRIRLKLEKELAYSMRFRGPDASETLEISAALKALDAPDNANVAIAETPEINPLTEEQKQEKRRINRRHAKETLQQLVNLNKLHFMYTFTFAVKLHKNVKGLRFILPLEKQRDRCEIESVWNKRRPVIARWCKKHGYAFKYVKVLEKHLGNKAEEADSEKVGTYHMHLATDKPIDKYILQKLWGYGVVWIDDFNRKRREGVRGKSDPGRDGIVVDPGMYMSKYMEKDFDDAELHGFRAYSPSHNLARPIPDRSEEEIDHLLLESYAEECTVFDKTFDIEYTLYRKGKEPELVSLQVRRRIFNFRVSPVFGRREPGTAGVKGVSYTPSHSPPGRAQVVGN